MWFAINSLNIEYMRTTSVIFKAVQKKIIDKKQALSMVNDLIEAGYYIAPRYIASITKMLLDGEWIMVDLINSKTIILLSWKD